MDEIRVSRGNFPALSSLSLLTAISCRDLCFPGLEGGVWSSMMSSGSEIVPKLLQNALLGAGEDHTDLQPRLELFFFLLVWSNFAAAASWLFCCCCIPTFLLLYPGSSADISRLICPCVLAFLLLLGTPGMTPLQAPGRGEFAALLCPLHVSCSLFHTDPIPASPDGYWALSSLGNWSSQEAEGCRIWGGIWRAPSPPPLSCTPSPHPAL